MVSTRIEWESTSQRFQNDSAAAAELKPMIPHIRPEFVCDRLTNPDNQPICGVLDTNEVTRHGVLKTVLVHRIVAQAGTKL